MCKDSRSKGYLNRAQVKGRHQPQAKGFGLDPLVGKCVWPQRERDESACGTMLGGGLNWVLE